MFSPDESPEGSPPPSRPGTPPLDPVGGSGPSGAPGVPPGFRGRSRSAPPVLWAARRFGRRLRRMSDEFQLQVLPRPKSVGGTPGGWGRGWRETLRAWWGPRPSPPS